MRRFWLLLVLAVVPLVAGCGSERERNKERNRDRPKVGEKEKASLPIGVPCSFRDHMG